MKILGLSAGNRAIWYNKKHPNCTYLDRQPEVDPDIVCDTRVGHAEETALKPEDIEAIEKRAEAATKGPWEKIEHRNVVSRGGEVQTNYNHGTRSWTDVVAVPHLSKSFDEGSDAEKNMTFIANARTDIPLLCAELRKAWKQIEIAKEALLNLAARGTGDPQDNCIENLMSEHANTALEKIEQPE